MRDTFNLRRIPVFRLRMNRLCILLLALIILTSPHSTLAQDPLTTQYISTSGAVSFSYPTGWTLSDLNGMIAMTNNAAVPSVNLFLPGGVAIIVFEPAMLDRILGGTDTQTLADIGPAIVPFLGNDDLAFEILNSQEIRIGNHSAIRLDGRAAVADGLLLVIDHGEGNIAAMAAMTALDEMGQSEETLMAIAASIMIAPTRPAIIRAHSDYIKALAFSPNSALIASASNDHTIRVWDVVSGIEMLTLNHDNWVSAVVFSADGTLIVAGGMQGFGGVVRVWDAAAGEATAELVHSGYVSSVAISPDGTLIAVGCDNEEPVYRWTLDGSWQETAPLSGHTGGIQAVTFSPNGALLASASQDGTVRVWDLASDAELLKLEHPDAVYSVAFSPDGALIASGSANGIVYLWDAVSGESVAELTGHSSLVSAVAFSPDGALIASGSHDKLIRVWAFEDAWQEMVILRGHTDWIKSVVFSPDGTQMGSGSVDGSMILWDVPHATSTR